MNTPEELYAEADALDAKAKELRQAAAEQRKSALKTKPLNDRLIYAATARCDCGAGLAYDPASDGDGVFKGPSKWECSDILRYEDLTAEEKARAKAATHTSPLPFAFYEIKSEHQPSQAGRTTRERAEPRTAA